jgi:hypothetical protein
MKALGLDFIRRVMVTTGVLSVLALLFISVYYDWRFGLGVFIGSAWGIANLHFLRELVVTILTTDEINRKKVVLFALVKFPGLYFAGYLILEFGGLSVLSFLIGFSLLFAVAVLKVLGRVLNEWLEKSGPPHNMNSTVR